LANHTSALKRHRQSQKARLRNRAEKTKVRNAVKAVRAAVESKDKQNAAEALKSAMSLLDKAASGKVVHWKNAARRISRLAKTVAAL
jgi:small subunit ribosomal protein S20